MRKLSLVAVAAAAFIAVPAMAQDAPAAAPAPVDASTQSTGATAPDGSKAFGIEPYFGILGGWEQFDNERNKAGIPQARNANGSIRPGFKPSGSLAEAVVGFNVPLGPVFVGAEGNIAKGLDGNVNLQYGGAGRFGARAGDSGLIYGKVGYEWVRFDHFANGSTIGTDHDYNSMTYGIGVEVGPKDIGLKGITGNAGFRIRAEMNTFGNFHSMQPMLGVITHF